MGSYGEVIEADKKGDLNQFKQKGPEVL